MSSFSSSPDPIDFHPPIRFGEEGQTIESDKEPLLITDPSEWVVRLQSCIVKMTEDAPHLATLSPPADAQIIQGYNALADKMDEIFLILATDEDDATQQIRDRYIDVINTSGRVWADLYMHLSNAKKKANEKLEMLTVLQKRQQFTATAFERFMAHSSKGKAPASKETTATAEAQPSGPIGPKPSQPTPNWGPEALIEILRPLIEARKETSRRPAMKLPELFDGSHSKLRDWWEKVKDYMDVFEPTMPTDIVKIKFVGSLLQGEARRWYDVRKHEKEDQNTADTWDSFSRELVLRFTDRQQKRRDHEKLKALQYEGSIQDYLAQFQELNSRVGLSGQGLQELILNQLTPQMGRAIYHRHGTIPSDDKALINAIRECGMIEEEFQRDKAAMKGSSKKPKSEGTPNHQEQGKGNQGKQGGRANQRNGQGKTSTQTSNPSSDKTNAGSNSQKSDKTAKKEQKDFSQLTKYWDSYKDAYQGVSWDETNKHKEMERDCRRCGHNGHGTLNCRAGKTIGGTELPPYPGKKTSAAVKRKRSPREDKDDDEQPPAQKEKPAAVASCSTRPPIWALSDSEESDF